MFDALWVRIYHLRQRVVHISLQLDILGFALLLEDGHDVVEEVTNVEELIYNGQILIIINLG